MTNFQDQHMEPHAPHDHNNATNGADAGAANFSSPAAHRSLSPWGDTNVPASSRGGGWTPLGTQGGIAMSPRGDKAVASSGRRLGHVRGAEQTHRDAFWRGPRTRPNTSRHAENDGRPTTGYVFAKEFEQENGQHIRRLNSRGQARAHSTATPRWGRALTSRGSQFEGSVRIKQLEILPVPLTAPAGAQRRVKSSKSSRTCKTARAVFATAPTMADNQATEVDVVVQAFAKSDNLHAAEMSARNPLMLPDQEQFPYSDLVRRQESPRERVFPNPSNAKLPDAITLNKIRYKKLSHAGKGPLARGLKHAQENRGPVKHLCDLNALEADEAEYLQRLEKNHCDSHVLLGYASYLFRKGRLAEAESAFRHVLELPFHGRSDDHANAIHAYGTFLWQTDRSQKAEAYFLTGLKFNNDHFEMLQHCALVMFARKAYIGAAEKFAHACRLCPDNTRVKLGHVVCLEHLGNSSQEDIDSIYQEIFAIDPAQPEALFSYALYCKSTGRKLLAKEFYERTLVATPSDATVLCSYGVFLSEQAFYDRALFAKAECMFTKALQQAPRDRDIIYSFAVTLSIKLRLLLYDAGASVQELDRCREVIRQREREHQGHSNPADFEKTLTNLRRMEHDEQQPLGPAESAPGKSLRGSLLFINTLTGRPERLSKFRHENVINKKFVNSSCVDGARGGGREGDNRSHLPLYSEDQARLTLQAVVRGHMARKRVRQLRDHCLDEGNLTFFQGYPFDQAQAFASHLFEEALRLTPSEPHILGAYAIFLFLVVGTPPAIERAQQLIGRALRLERSKDARAMAIYFIDLLRLHKGKVGADIARALVKEWGLQRYETLRPLTPVGEFEARVEAAKAEAYAEVYQRGKEEISAKYPNLDLFPSTPATPSTNQIRVKRTRRNPQTGAREEHRSSGADDTASHNALVLLPGRALVMKESAVGAYTREGWGMPPCLEFSEGEVS